jgi:hypothetical protein
MEAHAMERVRELEARIDRNLARFLAEGATFRTLNSDVKKESLTNLERAIEIDRAMLRDVQQMLALAACKRPI